MTSQSAGFTFGHMFEKYDKLEEDLYVSARSPKLSHMKIC